MKAKHLRSQPKKCYDDRVICNKKIFSSSLKKSALSVSAWFSQFLWQAKFFISSFFPFSLYYYNSYFIVQLYSYKKIALWHDGLLLISTLHPLLFFTQLLFFRNKEKCWWIRQKFLCKCQKNAHSTHYCSRSAKVIIIVIFNNKQGWVKKPDWLFLGWYCASAKWINSYTKRATRSPSTSPQNLFQGGNTYRHVWM